VPREYSEYTIANGIARHESVSEEEVARRVQRGMLGTLCREKQHA
jgi:adenine deaminase